MCRAFHISHPQPPAISGVAVRAFFFLPADVQIYGAWLLLFFFSRLSEKSSDVLLLAWMQKEMAETFEAKRLGGPTGETFYGKTVFSLLPCYSHSFWSCFQFIHLSHFSFH